MHALLRAFWEVAAAEDAAGRITFDDADLGATPPALYSRGRDAHPALVVSEEAFGRSLARAVGQAGARQLDSLAIEDLYLACACVERASGAAAAFESQFASVIRRAVRRVRRAHDDQEDVEQRVRARLLAPSAEGPARIADYVGRGRLEGWVAVAAIRIAISAGRSESAERRLHGKALAEAAGVDPERMLMKAEIRDQMKAVAAEAVRGLAERDRLALRLYLVSGLTVEAIGKSLGVTHQAVSKMLARARDGIRTHIQSGLKERLRLSDDELSSMLRFASSQVDLSISSALRG